MPVSGRPTNLPLLKITQGTKGPDANWLQKVRKDAGAGDAAEFAVREELRATARKTMVANAVTRRRERVDTAKIQPLTLLSGLRRSVTTNGTLAGVN